MELEGRRFVVFPCAFTPEVDPKLSEEALQAVLAATHPGGGAPYFRGICDRLHLYVTSGEGGRRLTARTEGAVPARSEETPAAEERPPPG